jgi:hypothetical protein
MIDKNEPPMTDQEYIAWKKERDAIKLRDELSEIKSNLTAIPVVIGLFLFTALFFGYV